MSRFKNRPARNGVGQVVSVLPDDPAFLARYPVIWEYMTIDSYDDGKPRQRSTLLFVVEDGAWKCCLNDRDQQRSLWLAGGSFEAVLAVLEATLDDPRAIWRHYQAARPKGGKGT